MPRGAGVLGVIVAGVLGCVRGDDFSVPPLPPDSGADALLDGSRDTAGETAAELRYQSHLGAFGCSYLNGFTSGITRTCVVNL